MTTKEKIENSLFRKLKYKININIQELSPIDIEKRKIIQEEFKKLYQSPNK